ncbi:hypothetical protein ANCCAN_26714 [Ancylostoma caninum]|uniref:Uncharacterized protein n=1 Tax=Ancylostoma caninum TaxID=29170 RepID=A0A368F5Z1_ANCCA|nr:hypothetical protein ANCCAN_26714 [Ancylostoma caninum]
MLTLLFIWALIDSDNFVGEIIKEGVVSTEEMEMEKTHPEMAGKMSEFVLLDVSIVVTITGMVCVITPNHPLDSCISGDDVHVVFLLIILVARRCAQVGRGFGGDRTILNISTENRIGSSDAIVL